MSDSIYRLSDLLARLNDEYVRRDHANTGPTDGAPTTTPTAPVSTALVPHWLVDPNVHPAAGLTAGYTIRADSATTYAWAPLQHTDLGTVTADQHHNHATLGAGSHAPLALSDQEFTLTMPTLTAGTGLSGGGVLSADRTVTVNTAYAFTWTARHTFESDVKLASSSKLYFGDTCDVALYRKAADILSLGPGDSLQSHSYVAGLSGWKLSEPTSEFQNVLVRGELRTSVFVKSLSTAFAGSMIVAKSAATLAAPVTPTGTTFTITVKNSPTGASDHLFSSGDICEIREIDNTPTAPEVDALTSALAEDDTTYALQTVVADIWFTVSTHTHNGDGTQTWDCTWNDGTTGVTFMPGTGIVDWGQAGQGFFAVSADGQYGANAAWVLGTHAGSPWSTRTIQVYAGTDGKMYAGAGKVTLDANGIRLDATTGKFSSASIEWYNGVTRQFSIGTRTDLGSVVGAYLSSPTLEILIEAPTIYCKDGDGDDAPVYCGNLYASAGVYVRVDGSGGGLYAGAHDDVQWYQNAEHVWRTPDSVMVDGGLNLNSSRTLAAGVFNLNTAALGVDTLGIYVEQCGSTTTNDSVRLQSSISGNATDYLTFTVDPGVGFLFTKAASGVGRVGILKTPTCELDVNGTIRADTGFNCAGNAGVADSTLEYICAISYHGDSAPETASNVYKKRTLTFKGGVVTGVGTDSGWYHFDGVACTVL